MSHDLTVWGVGTSRTMRVQTCLDWAAACGISLPETVSHYRQRVTLRPAYQAALKKNFVNY